MATETTPADIAAALARHWLGEITNVEIAEDLLGWSVRVTVKIPARRRPITWSETGETRTVAIDAAVLEGSFSWPKIHGVLA